MLNSAGSALVYSTYLGGSTGQDIAVGIIVDGAGQVYITGHTQGDFPITSGAFQPVYSGTSGDGFVAKINPALSGAASLVYSTYLGEGGPRASPWMPLARPWL